MDSNPRSPSTVSSVRARATRSTPPSRSPERPIVRVDALGDRFAYGQHSGPDVPGGRAHVSYEVAAHGHRWDAPPKVRFATDSPLGVKGIRTLGPP
jgi:hypothetical protein